MLCVSRTGRAPDLEEEYVNGRLSREMLSEKLHALSALQGRLRADTEGLERWLVVPRAVAQQSSEPLDYGTPVDCEWASGSLN